ncbi:MAG: hypothetical protein CMM28_05580 [Rhodospirillaceae bacterium]|nr:hypothetical protein [Rhodospirillaceae bacterium]
MVNMAFKRETGQHETVVKDNIGNALLRWMLNWLEPLGQGPSDDRYWKSLFIVWVQSTYSFHGEKGWS